MRQQQHTDITIVAYSDEHKKELLQLYQASSKAGHPFLSSQDIASQVALVEEHYLDMADIWIAIKGHTMAGFIGLMEAHIGGLFVAPQFFGQGIGRYLIEFAHKEKGNLSVEVYAANTAVTFYEHCGFQEVSRNPEDDEGRPLEVIRLEQKSLQRV